MKLPLANDFRDRVESVLTNRSRHRTYTDTTCCPVPCAVCSRPRHLKDAMIVFGSVGGEKVGRSCAAGIKGPSAGEPAQISFPLKRKEIVCPLHVQHNCISEAQYLAVLCVKARFVLSGRALRNETAQAPIVSVDFAQPAPIPAALNIIRRNWICGSSLPIAVKSRTTARKEQQR